MSNAGPYYDMNLDALLIINVNVGHEQKKKMPTTNLFGMLTVIFNNDFYQSILIVGRGLQIRLNLRRLWQYFYSIVLLNLPL